MEEHLKTVLSAAVNFPVAWGSMGSGTATPRATVYRVGGARDMTLDGPALMQGRIQVDCYGKTYKQAVEASRALREVLEGYSGGPVLLVWLDAVRDGFEGDAQILQRVSLTFSVRYRD